MTVKELKLALAGVPEETIVRALKDGVYSEYSDVWWANYKEQEDEDGNVDGEFVLNC
jgi:hypothetical protein